MKLNILCSDCHFDSVSDGDQFRFFKGYVTNMISVTHGPCCSRRCSRSPRCSPSTGRCSGKPSPSGWPPPIPPSSSQVATRTRRRWGSASSATLSSTSAPERSACTQGSAGRTGPGGGARSSTEGRTPGLKYVRIRIWSSSMAGFKGFVALDLKAPRLSHQFQRI